MASSFPGTFVDLTSYLHERIDETITTDTEDVVVRILGPSFGTLQRLSTESYFGRVAHSGQSRSGIWKHLDQTLGRSPLGIGPGNSQAVLLTPEERERPHSLMSKEAHNDYLGYLIEQDERMLDRIRTDALGE